MELMTGAFTDNQPDFSWLMPGEEKRFTQYFLPYKTIGAVKNASREAAVNLEVRDGIAWVGVYVSSPREGLCVRLEGEEEVLWEGRMDNAVLWYRCGTAGTGGRP